ncbi:MAG TPA: ABC transporter ATP-binding protein [Candidatus Limnocylindria bacterium]|jgi:NitT/TauT family transport system ATP-binding protein|nr:ABC transporter ATP-binding protein [Candidatus Limnocylindria bacterium]
MRIAIDGLSIRFRRGIEVVSDVGLDVPSGDFVTIVGPSGCGKSTLLNAIAGLLDRADCDIRGTISLDGHPAGSRAVRLGYVFQRDTLLPWRTILENVQLGLEIKRVPRAGRGRASELVSLVGLEGFEHYYPHQVSGGMRQRAQLIRTLAYDPDVILMDEPFGALDAHNRMLLQGELLRIWERRHVTVLFVTHDLAEAIVLGRRVVVMSRRPGRVKTVRDIDLAGPRDPFELRASGRFAQLETSIWGELRDEFRAPVVA